MLSEVYQIHYAINGSTSTSCSLTNLAVILDVYKRQQYMLQCGMPVPMHERSHAGLFGSIFIDIGDEQSIEDDLSTYSSHLTNMKTMMKSCNERSLILIDEFGGGTEPQIGGAIACLLYTSRCV